MKCPWDTPNDIQRYLSGTVFRYKGHPYYFQFDGLSRFSYYALTDTDTRLGQVSYDDPDIDVEPLELGYYQGRDRVLRMERHPQKQWSQGLTKNNCTVWKLDGSRHADYNHPLLNQGVVDMLTGNYPTLDECFVILETKKEVALSRDIALASTGKGYPYTVFYKGDIVGFIPPGTRKVVVPNTAKAWIVSKFLAQFSWEIE